jgi:hypothetical protein
MRTALAMAGGGTRDTSVIAGSSRELGSAAAPAGRAAPGGDARWIVRVLLLVAGAVAVAVLITSLAAQDENGGSGDGRDGNGDRGSGGPLTATVSDFDPYGDGEEHSDEASLAADGNTSTAWTTENYTSSLELQGKAGVGLVFDLGDSVEVSSVKITGLEDLELEVRASDQPGDDETSFEEIDSSDGTDAVETMEFEAVEARYWLVWITSLPGDTSGTASIAEVEFGAP